MQTLAGRPAQSVLLGANEYLQATRSGGLSASHTVDTSRVMAWQRGEIVADALTIAKLANELARYSSTRIVVGSREVAALTVSGVLSVNHPDTVVQALERSLGLRLTSGIDNPCPLQQVPQRLNLVGALAPPLQAVAVDAAPDLHRAGGGNRFPPLLESEAGLLPRQLAPSQQALGLGFGLGDQLLVLDL